MTSHFVLPMPFKIASLIHVGPIRFRRTHISHMRMDRMLEPSAATTAFLVPSNLEFPICYGRVLRLRGGYGSESDDPTGSDSDSPAPSKKRKVKRVPATKRKGKGKGKAVAEPDPGLRITLGGTNGTPGIFVDEVVDIYDAPECWNIPESHRVAYILDLSATPERLQQGGKEITVDKYIKKQANSWDGPTGSRTTGLAKVTILDEDSVISCRRSNLKCNGFFNCSLAAPDHLADFERWDDSTSATQELISAPKHAAKIAEANDVVAIATSFYRSVNSKHCKAKDDGQFQCGGHAILRKFRSGKSNGKSYFVGCSNWDDGDGLSHRFTQIPRQLFRGEEITVDDAEIVEGPCSEIVHPSHLPKNKHCPAQKYKQSIDAVGLIGTTTLRVDKAASTKTILGGLLPEEVHPSMINKRKRREMVKDARSERFPQGAGLPGVFNEFQNEQFREMGDRYIHAVTFRADMHVIITINPELAAMVHDASWIMVDTTFAVVHGTTNEWKLLIWLNGLDKRTVIGRVWTNRATRETFVLVWNGIFDAIEQITGRAVNFKIFSKNSSLLGAIGDSEGAQAQGLGDVIILRGMNSPSVNGSPTVTVDSILFFIWKTCLVHFKRGVFALEAHIDEFVFNCLLGFPYLETLDEIAEYRTFCENSTNTKVQNWWAHKISYPWLLPSLNRSLTSMSKLHWDLTPGDTNPIEGSHVQDNQVNATNRSLLEAILLYDSGSNAREYDENTARRIKASITAGVMEDGNNSLEACFSAAARRQARARTKTKEKAAADGGSKVLKARLKTSEQQSKAKDAEIQRLRALLSAPTAGPSTPRRGVSSSRNARLNSPAIFSPVAGPSRLPQLNLFPNLPPMPPINEPRSDFDYPGALNSDVLDATLHHIAHARSDDIMFDAQDRAMYNVGDSDDEILMYV
ncbi:hypothetical protein C8R46DRAFT_1294194 [Mycena filopes]|nr:hypothetical protein C8R46DRAFT_1294194 [Mycena filopes]